MRSESRRAGLGLRRVGASLTGNAGSQNSERRTETSSGMVRILGMPGLTGVGPGGMSNEALDQAMARYAEGDEPAFAVLYDELSPRLFSFL